MRYESNVTGYCFKLIFNSFCKLIVYVYKSALFLMNVSTINFIYDVGLYNIIPYKGHVINDNT
jgi:hypothetical protein